MIYIPRLFTENRFTDLHILSRLIFRTPGFLPRTIRSQPNFPRASTSSSIVASILYRAAPIDPALKPGSPPHQASELSRFESPSADTPASQSTDTDLPKSFSPVLPDLSGIGKYNSSEYRESFPGSVSVSASLPGLAALASVASAPTSNLRYVCEGGKL